MYYCLGYYNTRDCLPRSFHSYSSDMWRLAYLSLFVCVCERQTDWQTNKLRVGQWKLGLYVLSIQAPKGPDHVTRRQARGLFFSLVSPRRSGDRCYFSAAQRFPSYQRYPQSHSPPLPSTPPTHTPRSDLRGHVRPHRTRRRCYRYFHKSWGHGAIWVAAHLLPPNEDSNWFCFWNTRATSAMCFKCHVRKKL